MSVIKNDLKYFPLELLGLSVSMEEMRKVEEMLEYGDGYGAFIETTDAYLYVNQPKRLIKVLYRKYAINELYTDVQVVRMLKIAHRAKINIEYETYLLN